jgi:hypothetical protein
MKSTLTIVMFVLSAGYTLAAFAGLVGILPNSAFLGSEVAFFLYSLAGLAFIGLNDTGRRTSTEYAV